MPRGHFRKPAPSPSRPRARRRRPPQRSRGDRSPPVPPLSERCYRGGDELKLNAEPDASGPRTPVKRRLGGKPKPLLSDLEPFLLVQAVPGLPGLLPAFLRELEVFLCV